MKYIEDMYDSKYSHEMREIEREDDSSVSTNVNNLASIFPYFVVKNVSNIVGLRTLTDQHCWDLLYSVHHYRKDYLEVEMFARFLQEFYYPEDLLFFIYVRNTIAKSFHLSFKGRWAKAEAGPGRQPLPLWMSYKECLHISKILYDDENKIRDFMKILNSHMVGQKSDISDTRRLDISMFLHFAVVDYHQTHEGQHDGPGAFFVPPLTAPHHTPTQKQQTSKTTPPNNVNLFDIASSDDHMVDNHLDSYLAALHQERRQNREERGSIGSIGSGYTLDQINLQSIAFHQQQYDEEEGIDITENDYNQMQAISDDIEEKRDQIIDGETEIGEEEKGQEVNVQYIYNHHDHDNVHINIINNNNKINNNEIQEEEEEHEDIIQQQQHGVGGDDEEVVVNEEVEYYGEGGEEVVVDEEEEDESDEFTAIQLEIENELLAKLLMDTPDDVIDYIAPEIQNRLRLRIHTEIENIEITDLEHFKQALTIIAEDADVYNELETYRDELLHHILNGE